VTPPLYVKITKVEDPNNRAFIVIEFPESTAVGVIAQIIV
jgi:hypothetical protein